MEKPRCTWQENETIGRCAGASAQVLRSEDGQPWAALCAQHYAEHEAALAAQEPRAILRCWVKASGGAAKLARRITGKP